MKTFSMLFLSDNQVHLIYFFNMRQQEHFFSVDEIILMNKIK